MRALGPIWILGLDREREPMVWVCLVRGTAWARHGSTGRWEGGRDDFGREGDIRQERYTVDNTAGFMRCRKV